MGVYIVFRIITLTQDLMMTLVMLMMLVAVVMRIVPARNQWTVVPPA